MLEAVREKNSSKEGLAENKNIVGNLSENHHEIVRVHALYKGRQGNSKNASEIQDADFIRSETGRQNPKRDKRQIKKNPKQVRRASNFLNNGKDSGMSYLNVERE